MRYGLMCGILLLACFVLSSDAKCEEGYAAGKVLSEWKLVELDDNKVPNGVEGLTSMIVADKTPPEITEAGVVFKDGKPDGLLVVSPGDIPGFLDGKSPFDVKFVFNPSAIPTNSGASLFDPHGPILIQLRGNMQFSAYVIKVNPEDGKKTLHRVDSKTVFAKGTEYEVVARFLEGKLQLFVNGKLDAEIEAPLPDALTKKSVFKIGQGWGGDGFKYNGTIKSVTISAIPGADDAQPEQTVAAETEEKAAE